MKRILSTVNARESTIRPRLLAGDVFRINARDDHNADTTDRWWMASGFVLSPRNRLAGYCYYAVFWKALPKIFATGSVHRVILLSVYSATFLGVATWSVWAGLKLWLVQPGADKFARKYLVGYLAANVGYFAFWYVVSRPATSLSLAQMGWYHIVGPIGSTALWYFYLENSARVRETYSTPEF